MRAAARCAGLGPLFAGETDLDQLGRVTAVLGSIDERSWPGARQLPDYGKAWTHCRLPSSPWLQAQRCTQRFPGRPHFPAKVTSGCR